MHSPGSVLAGRYRLDQRVGAGGMGEVWRATDETLGRVVAVKVMQPALLEDPSFGARFRAEARMMASIDHPGVVAVHDYYRDDSIALLAMDYVEGESLARLLARQGRLPVARTMQVIAQAADALQAAHEKGVVHRDVKPANLLVRPDGTVVLTDFGIARTHAGTQLTATGAMLGTLSYLAPEQVLGEPAAPRSDVYALGVVAYECLTGRRPFERENPFASAMARVREAPPTLAGGIPPAVAAIVERALAVDPAHRPASAAELAAACRRATGAAPTSAPPTPAASGPPPGPLAAPPGTAGPYGAPLPPPGPPYGPGTPVPPVAQRRRRGTGLAIAAGVTVMVMVWAAVGYTAIANVTGGGDDDGDGPGPGPGPVVSAAVVEPGCEPFAAYQGMDGSTVSIAVSGTADVVSQYGDASQSFTDCTGINVDYTQIEFSDFEPYLETRIAADQPPDLAVVSSPRLLAELATNGALVPAAPEVEEAVVEGWTPAYADLGAVDGVPYGVPLGIAVHSLVWYSPGYFADHGYEVPQSWEDMVALSDEIVADGDTPWCDGWGELAWPGSIWVAEALLRRHGPEVYEQWLRHEIPFDHPDVVEAMDLVGEILKDPDYVNGGLGDVDSIAEVRYDQAGQPVLTGECAMYRQAEFYGNVWPDGTELGEDGDVWVFYLPPFDGAAEGPAVVNGEFVVALAERPEVMAMHAHLASAEWASARTAVGDWATGHQGVDPADAADPIDRAVMELIQVSGVELHPVPDGLLPPEVNSAFWDELTSWILGQDSQTTAANVERAWP